MLMHKYTASTAVVMGPLDKRTHQVPQVLLSHMYKYVTACGALRCGVQLHSRPAETGPIGLVSKQVPKSRTPDRRLGWPNRGPGDPLPSDTGEIELRRRLGLAGWTLRTEHTAHHLYAVF